MPPTLTRRGLLGLLATGSASVVGGAADDVSRPLGAGPLPQVQPREAFAARPLLRFTAGEPGRLDLSRWFRPQDPAATRLRLRANIMPRGSAATPLVTLPSQQTEFSLDGNWLSYDASAGAATAVGAAAARLQIESSDSAFDNKGAFEVSEIATIVVDAPAATIGHGLDRWPSFDAVSRAVMGNAAPGSAPRGRTDLIGTTFEISPGMLSEALGRPAPVVVLQFPCTVRALDPIRRPVLRSVSGERDIVQIQAGWLPPIDGEVVLQDLVIRDNRSWYDTGEAGVRIKDRFAGRSVRIERCEFVRCQNAVAGGTLGQTLRIFDCRIVDCGVGEQAHALYVQPQWLEFFGNLVMQSTGNRQSRAHLLKSRALNARILGNRFELGYCPGSYLIDLPNGGEVEIGGNQMHHGPVSDNSRATLIAYAPEGAHGDLAGRPPRFSPGRRFSLTARNNTLASDFPGRTQAFAIDRHVGQRAEGGQAFTDPDPLLIVDNVFRAVGAKVLVACRDRSVDRTQEQDDSARFPDNSIGGPVAASLGEDGSAAPRNAAGPYAARRFTGGSALGTGSAPYTFVRHGAG